MKMKPMLCDETEAGFPGVSFAAGAVAAPSAPRAGSEEGLSAAQQSGTPRRSSRRQPTLLDVTAAPGAGRCAPDPRPLSHPSDPPCAAHLSAVRRLERLSPNRDV